MQTLHASIPVATNAMLKYGKNFELKIYNGVDHGFFNEERTDKYNSQASKDAWEKPLNFFNEHLKQ